MQTSHFEIEINAPVAKVWDTMLSEPTYRQWTAVFMPGSTFEGSWQEGELIRFLAPDENGKPGGMVARIKANRPHEFISIEHLGIVADGKDVTSGEEVEDWAGALENYTFEDMGNGKTKVKVDVDLGADYQEDMEKAWPQALNDLKRIAEA